MVNLEPLPPPSVSGNKHTPAK